MTRLSRLEDIIRSLREQLDAKSSLDPGAEEEKEEMERTRRKTINSLSQDPGSYEQTHDPEAAELGTEFGRLAVGEGRSRYVAGNFWAVVSEEVGHFKQLVNSGTN